MREAVRAVVLDSDDRVLLARFAFPSGDELWATPGGGVEPGESDEHALRRELSEETGLDDFDLGPLVWTRVHEWEDLNPRWDGQRERTYLLRVPPFDPAPRFTAEALAAEFVHGLRWWTIDELESSGETFAPERLPELVAAIVRGGPPASAMAVG